MHKLLARLVRRHLSSDFDTSVLDNFLTALSRAFDQNDLDREMQERSLMLTSKELNDINQTLHVQLLASKNSQQLLEETLTAQRAIINTTPVAILNFEANGTLSHANEGGLAVLGLSEKQLRSNTLRENVRALLDTLVDPETFLTLLKEVDQDELTVVHEEIETKNGKRYECYSAPAIHENKYISRVWCFRDITESIKNQERLHHQAFHDDLTGLPNRSLLLRSIDHAMTLAKRHSTRVAVLFIDLDDFKKINDTAGHEKGDEFLVKISKEINGVLRESDIIGRLGGDEFLVVLEGIEKQQQIIRIHDRILNLFSKPFVIDENNYFVSASIGISIYPQDGEESEVLIRKSDMAMYQAKRNGKNTFHYFDNNLERIALHRVSIESQLRSAIENNEFIFHYQPKINLKTQKVVSLEMLIRWKPSESEIVYPDNFIPIAEDTGLIREITKIVIQNACAKIKNWQGTVLEKIPMSINISALDFADSHFINFLVQNIEEKNINPSLIELELTESVFFDDILRVKRDISILKSLGVLLSIDDFGTGYSSFSYLHDLDIDYLKIDKSFVKSLEKSVKSKAIVKSIIDLGKNLGIDVVAEGVETKEDHNFLYQNGCHVGQGYYYSRPVGLENLIEVVESENKL